MSYGISMSSGARACMLALQAINADMARLQSRLATGRKVNAPTDDPAAYFTSAALSNRANALSTVLGGVGTAKSTLSAAANGIAAIQALVASAQSIANSALQSTAAPLASVTGTRVLTTGTDIVSGTGSATQFKNGDIVTVSDGTTTATYTANSGADTVQVFLDAINNTAGLKVTASLNGSGNLVLTATDTVDITVGATLGGAGTLSGIVGLTTGTTSFVPSSARASYATQFNTLRAQIDALVSDASYNGVNLLSGGSLSALFNDTGSSSYNIAGVTATSAGLGLSAASNTFQTDAAINTALLNVSAALSSLQSMSTQFSTATSIIDTRTSFTNSMIDFLNSASEEMVATDTNADGAALLALQTRQQIAATTLSLAQTAETSTLRLFGLGD